MVHRRCRRTCSAIGADGEIFEGDVVEYPLPEGVRRGGLYGDKSYGLGAVHDLVLDNSTSSLVCHIEPLVMVFPYRLHTDTEKGGLAIGNSLVKTAAREFRVGVRRVSQVYGFCICVY